MCRRKKNKINFSKANTKFWLSLHINCDESYVYVKETEICKFKANENMSGYNISLGSVSKDFTNDEQCAIFLNSTVYDFSA